MITSLTVKPPADLPSVLVATGEALARRLGIDPPLFWAYLYRRAAPPADVRAALVEAFFPRVAPDDFLIEGSTSVPNDATIGTVMQTQSEPHLFPGPRPTDHEWTRALRERGITITEAAGALGVTRAAAKSWILPPPHGRKIPRAHAVAIRKRYGVPLSAWPNGITERVSKK